MGDCQIPRRCASFWRLENPPNGGQIPRMPTWRRCGRHLPNVLRFATRTWLACVAGLYIEVASFCYTHARAV